MTLEHAYNIGFIEKPVWMGDENEGAPNWLVALLEQLGVDKLPSINTMPKDGKPVIVVHKCGTEVECVWEKFPYDDGYVCYGETAKGEGKIRKAVKGKSYWYIKSGYKSKWHTDKSMVLDDTILGWYRVIKIARAEF